MLRQPEGTRGRVLRLSTAVGICVVLGSGALFGGEKAFAYTGANWATTTLNCRAGHDANAGFDAYTSGSGDMVFAFNVNGTNSNADTPFTAAAKSSPVFYLSLNGNTADQAKAVRLYYTGTPQYDPVAGTYLRAGCL